MSAGVRLENRNGGYDYKSEQQTIPTIMSGILCCVQSGACGVGLSLCTSPSPF